MIEKTVRAKSTNKNHGSLKLKHDPLPLMTANHNFAAEGLWLTEVGCVGGTF